MPSKAEPFGTKSSPRLGGGGSSIKISGEPPGEHLLPGEALGGRGGGGGDAERNTVSGGHDSEEPRGAAKSFSATDSPLVDTVPIAAVEGFLKEAHADGSSASDEQHLGAAP